MKGNKLEFKSPDDVEVVYYEAFQRCDAAVMAALWADGDVICVHPGSGPIVGHEAVVRSWKHILTNARMPALEVKLAKRTVTDDLSVHVVTEQVATGEESTATVLATNVYQKFDSGWLMIEHHASVIEAQQDGQTLQ